MKMDNFFTIKDFFNYYLPGFVYLLNIILISIQISAEKVFLINIKQLAEQFEKTGVAVTVIFSIIAPYILGFILLPISEWTRKMWCKFIPKFQPNPRKWLLLKSEDSLDNGKAHLKGNRIPKEEVKLIKKLAKKS